MAQNKTYCGTCNLWLAGLWTHEARSKSHRQKLAIIKAENIKLGRGRCASTIVNTPDTTTAQAR